MAGGEKEGERGQREILRQDSALEKEKGGKNRENKRFSERTLPPKNSPPEKVQRDENTACNEIDGFRSREKLSARKMRDLDPRKEKATKPSDLLADFDGLVVIEIFKAVLVREGKQKIR